MQPLNPPTVLTPSAGYSQGVVAGDALYVAGQVSADAGGEVVGAGDIVAQTRQAIKNIELILEAAGMGLANVVSTTVYLTDLAHYDGFGRAWCDAFGDHAPARATVRADLIHPDLLVEIQAIAVRSATQPVPGAPSGADAQ